MISPPSKEQFNSRPEDSWPLFSLEFFWHGSLTELRVSDFSPETGRFIQLSAAAVTTETFSFYLCLDGKTNVSVRRTRHPVQCFEITALSQSCHFYIEGL